MRSSRQRHRARARRGVVGARLILGLVVVLGGRAGLRHGAAQGRTGRRPTLQPRERTTLVERRVGVPSDISPVTGSTGSDGLGHVGTALLASIESPALRTRSSEFPQADDRAPTMPTTVRSSFM